MAISRRQFLKRTGATTAGALFAPSFFGNPFVRSAIADTIGDRFLIILNLSGGNDGQNTVIPVADGSAPLRQHYETHRRANGGGIRITPAELSATTVGNDPGTGAPLGLHPGLGGLMPAWAANELAVIQACGYPDYSLSHDQSATIWQTANPTGNGVYAGTGWAGRHLAANYGPLEVPGVAISSQVPTELGQTATSVLAIERLEGFGFPYNGNSDPQEAAKNAAFQALYGSSAANLQSAVAYIGNSGISTLTSTQAYAGLHDAYINRPGSRNDDYDLLDSGTADDFREIAKVIWGVMNGTPNVGARFFQLEHGGFDTHSDQGGAETNGQHYGLHAGWSQALALFREELQSMDTGSGNAWDKTLIVTYSEFSRRIPQNDNGTDHGSQGPMFVVGGSVNGGVYGNHANINPAALDDSENTVYSQNPSDPYRSTDFRDVYGTILKHWTNMPAPQILSSILPVDSGDPNLYWTAGNDDFDMGFVS